MKDPHAIALGRKGGQVKGPTKARTSEQARAAVMARWAKAKPAAVSIRLGKGVAIGTDEFPA